MYELKPCPFCGGDANVFFPTEHNETRFFALCKKCGAKSREVIKPYLDLLVEDGEEEFYSSMDEVVKAWNRRAGEESKDA